MAEVFRFVSFRAPEEPQTEPIRLDRDRSAYQEQVTRDLEEDRPREELRRHAEEFLASDEYVSSVSDLAIPIAEFGKALNALKKFSQKSVLQVVKTVLKSTEVVLSEAYGRDRRRLADSLTALAVLDREREECHQELVEALRLCHLLELLAESDEILDDEADVERALNATLVFPKGVFPLARVKKARAEEERLAEGERKARRAEAERSECLKRSRRLRAALAELNGLPSPLFREPPRLEAVEQTSRPASLWSRLGAIFGLSRSQSVPVSTLPVSVPEREETLPWLLSESAIERLSQDTKRELKALNIAVEENSFFEIFDGLETELARLFHELAPPPRPTRFRAIGSTLFPENLASQSGRSVPHLKSTLAAPEETASSDRVDTSSIGAE